VEDRAVTKEEGCTINISIADKKKEEVIIAKDICVAVMDIIKNVGIAVVPKQADIAESTGPVLLAFSNRERMHC
jgi:hypothetical protein